MKQPLRIGFGILLPPEPFNYARRVERRLCESLGISRGLRQPPHITVKPPFAVESIEPFTSYLDNLAVSMPSIRVTLDGYDAFAPHVLFLSVQPNVELLNLHLRILRDLSECFGISPGPGEGEQVRFHSTIALGDMTEETFTEVETMVRQDHPTFSFDVSRLGVFVQAGEDGSWIVCHEAEVSARA